MKKLKILYEDKDLLVVRKDDKVLTVSDGKSYNTLYSEVYDYLHKKNQRVFVVHRLDKDTSGLVLFAKSERVKNIMQDNWDKVVRKYYAVVCGKLNGEAEVKQYLSNENFLTEIPDFVIRDYNGQDTLVNDIKEIATQIAIVEHEKEGNRRMTLILKEE